MGRARVRGQTRLWCGTRTSARSLSPGVTMCPAGTLVLQSLKPGGSAFGVIQQCCMNQLTQDNTNIKLISFFLSINRSEINSISFSNWSFDDTLAVH